MLIRVGVVRVGVGKDCTECECVVRGAMGKMCGTCGGRVVTIEECADRAEES